MAERKRERERSVWIQNQRERKRGILSNRRRGRRGGRDLSVVANSEGIIATGYDGANRVGLEGFDDAGPFFLFVITDTQLVVLS